MTYTLRQATYPLRVAWWLLRSWFGVAFIALVVLIYFVARADEKKCDELMALARTPRDSLDAKIACENIRSSTATTIAIGAGAGAIAGSAVRR